MATRSKPKPAPLPAPSERQRFRRHLLAWYRAHGRDLPWRNTSDPYHILVSEIMLQQTQVDRVLPKYHEWLGKYPSFEVLAEAPATEVVATWYPLGYNIRPRRLQSIAQQAVANHGGQLPSDAETLLSFKGIGEYTAGAIRSFAFRQRAAILDTNVARVLYRVFIGKGDIKSHAMKKRLWALSRVAGAAQARVRLQPGVDGLRRDAVPGAQAAVPGVPDEEVLPLVPAAALACGASPALEPCSRWRRGSRARRSLGAVAPRPGGHTPRPDDVHSAPKSRARHDGRVVCLAGVRRLVSKGHGAERPPRVRRLQCELSEYGGVGR